jgi:hypothetical protein
MQPLDDDSALSDPASLRSAWFPRDRVRVVGSIPRLTSPSRHLVGRHVRNRRAFILSDALAEPFSWSLERLVAAAGDETCSVFVSRQGQFPGLIGKFDRDRFRRVELGFRECIQRLAEPHSRPPLLWSGESLYLYQQPITPGLAALLEQVKISACFPEAGVGAQRHIWISQPGNITPPHVDFKENLLVQLDGHKHVLLWDAPQYAALSLASFKEDHAAHSRVDITDPDLTKFPRFASAEAIEGWLNPGEALFIPFDAIHCVRSATFCVSVNFWWGSELRYQTKRLLGSPLRAYVARNALRAYRAAKMDRRGHRE